MSAAPVNTRVSVEEYLRMNAKPAFEYVHGILLQKPMPTFRHSLTQGHLILLFGLQYPAFAVLPELTVPLELAHYRVPDIALIRRDQLSLDDPYPTKPVYLCIEIVSPGGRISELLAKCEAYHKWGVPHCWVLDPQERVAWQSDAGEEPKMLTSGAITAGEIALDLAAIFSVLDER